MALVDKTGISNGGTIDASHITNLYDALSGVGSYSVKASGSFLIPNGSNQIQFTDSTNNGYINIASLPTTRSGYISGLDSLIASYGGGAGLYVNLDNSNDVGGLKITNDGVAIFGGGDDDLLKVIDEDTGLQQFSINASGYVGINKTGVAGESTPTNASLDVNGNAIISGSLTVTGVINGSGIGGTSTAVEVFASSESVAISGSRGIYGYTYIAPYETRLGYESGNTANSKSPWTGSAQNTGSGYACTYVGSRAGNGGSYVSSMLADYSVYVGYNASALCLTSSRSVSVGSYANSGLLFGIGHVDSVAIGAGANQFNLASAGLNAGADIQRNFVAIGSDSQYFSGKINDSVAIGYRSGYSNPHLQQSVMIGSRAGESHGNAVETHLYGANLGTYIGYKAGFHGSSSIESQDTGSVYIGWNAGAHSSGIYQTGQTGQEYWRSSYNIAIGYKAGGMEYDQMVLQNSGSIYIGYRAEFDGESRTTGTGGNGNIVLGYNIALPNLDSDSEPVNGHATIGNVLYMRNLNSGDTAHYPSSSPITSGKVAIGMMPGIYQFELYSNSAAKPSSNVWTVSSDARLKENIEEANYDTCYDIVKNLPLKRYTWKDNVYTTQQVADRSVLGWIAQDVQSIFPKAVISSSFSGSGDFHLTDCLSLDSGQINAALYGTAKKLILENETLKLQVSASNAEIQAIKTHLGL